MLKNILIIANPGSGKGVAPEYARTLKDTLKETYPCEIEIRETTDVGDATEWAKAAKEENFDYYYSSNSELLDKLKSNKDCCI